MGSTARVCRVTGTAQTVDDYVAALSDGAREVLAEIRRRANDAVPGAQERIAYGMPTIALGGRNVVHFAAWRRHVSVYPVPAGDAAFDREIAPYLASRGTARFPLDRPVPYDLIEQMVRLLATARG